MYQWLRQHWGFLAIHVVVVGGGCYAVKCCLAITLIWLINWWSSRINDGKASSVNFICNELTRYIYNRYICIEFSKFEKMWSGSHRTIVGDSPMAGSAETPWGDLTRDP